MKSRGKLIIRAGECQDANPGRRKRKDEALHVFTIELGSGGEEWDRGISPGSEVMSNGERSAGRKLARM